MRNIVQQHLVDAEFLLINLSEEDVITINGISVKLIPAWKWLLDKT